MKWMRKLLSLSVALSLVLSVVSVAHALPNKLVQGDAFQRMSALGVANGILRADGTQDPALGDAITRAQMMVIIVRAFGAEVAAEAMKGTQIFPDVKSSHWASGYVAVAVKLAAEKGVVLGRSNGNFDPDAQVTLAEALAFIMKFLGVQRDTAAAWPNDYIQGAVAAGVITPQERVSLLDFPSLPASRGMAFALADTIFYNYKGLAGGKSVYTTYLDQNGPKISFSAVPATTEADSFTIAGKVETDTTELTFGNAAVRFTSDGSFTIPVSLTMGANSFQFTAKDLAGNVTQSPLTITRVEPAPVGPLIALVTPSKDVAAVLERVTFKAYGEDGKEITEGVTYSVDNEDVVILRNGVFQAVLPGTYYVKATVGKRFATAQINVYGPAAKLKIEADPIVANGLPNKTVTIVAVDQIGTPVLNFGQNGETARLTGTGVTTYDMDGVEAAAATFKDGKATFKVALSSYLAGEKIEVTARHEGDETLTGTGELQGAFPVATTLKIEGPTYLAANKGVTLTNAIKVWVVDQDGNPVPSPYLVNASIVGPASLIDTSSAYSNSAAPALFDINNWNTVGITGQIRITFSVDGVGSGVHVIDHVIAGSPQKLALKPDKSSKAATETFTLTAEIQDRNGIPVTYSEVSDLTLNVVLPADLQDKFELPLTAPVIARGQTSTTFTLSPKAKFTGNVPVTVNGGSTMTGSTTLTVVAGSVFSRSFDRTSALVPVSAPSATFTGYLADRWGNPVVQRDLSMKVHVQEVASTSAVSGTPTNNVLINGHAASPSAPLTVKTDENGRVNLSVTAVPYANKTYLLTLTDANGGDAAYAYLTVLVTVPNRLDVSTYRYIHEGDRYLPSSNLTAGDVFYVKVRATDTWGGPVANLGNDLRMASNKVFSVDGTNLANNSEIIFQPFSAISGNTKLVQEMGLQEGDYVATLVGGLAGSQVVTVEYNATVNKITGAKGVTVNPGEFSRALLNDGKAIKVKVGSVSGPYVLKLADRFGNQVTSTIRREIILQPMLNGIPTTAIGFRESLAGANLSKVEIQALTNIYMDVNTLGTFTINVLGGPQSGQVEVEVQSN